MGRLFFIIAIFILGWLAFRYFRTLIMLREQKQQQQDAKPKSIQEVRPCSYCGIHMPEDEMLTKNKLYFCSYQHMLEFDDKQQ
jgi:hypothetical protein